MTDAFTRPKIAAVFGGRSSEHGVSCSTAKAVVSVIDPNVYEVVPIGITTEGRWVRQALDFGDLPTGVLPSVSPDAPPFSWDELCDFDLVFPLLHGPWGEDGTIQGLFEMADVRYVGPGVLASAVGMDKTFTKLIFASAGIPQVPHVTIVPGEWEADRDRVEARAKALGLPAFVKPARAGSSSGVSMVNDWADLEKAVEVARQFDPKVLIEAAAKGRELECGVIQDADGSVLASTVGERSVKGEVARHDFTDFESKYLDGSGSLVAPAPGVPDSVIHQIQAYAKTAFTALNCEGLARVDFFWGGDSLVINEINTMPGFTATSMFPLLWEAVGVSYAELVDRLIKLALARPLGLR